MFCNQFVIFLISTRVPHNTKVQIPKKGRKWREKSKKTEREAIKKERHERRCFVDRKSHPEPLCCEVKAKT
jgi:hypothetical protein